MRILDQNSDQSLNTIILYLKLSEALELRNSLNSIIDKQEENHSHISSEDYRKEVTVCIYDENSLEGFNERSKTIILNDI